MPKVVRLPATSTRNAGEVAGTTSVGSGRDQELRSPATGQFQRGKSGNPAGRRSGSGNVSHLRLRALLAEDAEAVLRGVVLAALNGDMLAARLVLDRALPRRVCRPSMELDLPALKTPADAAAALAKIVAGTADGLLSATEASDMARVVEAFTGSLVANEMAARIEELESRLNEIQS